MLLLASAAQAFCGTFIGPAGSSLDNDVSQVIIAREGTRTTLTIANSVAGDTPSFGLVIPVPEVLEADQVSIADRALFEELDAYSTPRIVSYTCDDLYGSNSTSASSADDSGGIPEGEPADGVVVEASYTVGEYDIAVVSATGAEGLVAWLDGNGFEMDAAVTPVVEEYITAGQYFLAARVDLDDLPAEQAYLSPLQFRYDTDAFTLPIKIGTTVSSGEQDVVIYGFTPAADGALAVANYPGTEVQSDCMMPEGTVDHAAFYDAQLADAFVDGMWLTEYAWNPAWCDPCSSEPPSSETLGAVGAVFDGSTDYYYGNAFFTRLHLRYAPEEATQDLVLYATGSASTSQVKYITWAHALESDFVTCGPDQPDDPGSCAEEGYTDTDGDGIPDLDEKPTVGTADCGCGTTGRSSGAFAGALAVAIALLRRSRVR